ncbi:MAG: thiamine pyrophosphate-dependent dehydrogenase E1 component subunit alpha [Gemmatimonadetes bacterium]|nr:thiamine pyrophosphate-dependent dehydrogenase E1 component subunit alpha [Gemmatimonadota bacterium]
MNDQPIPAGLSREQLLEIFYYLTLTRALEERLVNLYRQGKVIGGLYRSLGQEGESVGSAYALQSGDVLSPLIRNLGSMLVKGARPVEVLRQYMAKATSPTAGREMNVHFNDLDLGYLGQVSPLGDMIPVMAGICLSFKMRGEPRVGLVYIGDGGASTGAFHEGINLAAASRLPLVVIIENNGYAYSTPTSAQAATERLADRAKAYGIPGETIDGNDVLLVYETTKAAADRARAGAGAAIIEVVTYRRKGHAEHDDQRYQPPEEIALWAETNDPIDRYVQRLLESGWAIEAELDAVGDSVNAELDAAVAECENDPLPDIAGALTDVYACSAGEPLWFRRLDA